MRNQRRYWTYERCKEEALKYKIKKDFKLKSTAYSTIEKNKWYELLNHMIEIKKPNGFWTYEQCKETALKYKTIKELKYNCISAYTKIIKSDWRELFQHMEILGNRFKRLIYVYEFPDNTCYIGLTGNINLRKQQHLKMKNSCVYKYIKNTKLNPNIKIKSDYIETEKASLLEGEILKQYKSEGWIILNKIKTGSIGHGKIKWDYISCKDEAKKYSKISEFAKYSYGAYNAAKKHNWLKDISIHFNEKRTNGYWNNKELCYKESKKYKNKTEFRLKCWAAYNYSKINNWLSTFYEK